MSIQEIQDLKDNHFKCDRLLSLMRMVGFQLQVMRCAGVVNSRTAILIHQMARLEMIYDDLVCKIADVTITSRNITMIN